VGLHAQLRLNAVVGDRDLFAPDAEAEGAVGETRLGGGAVLLDVADALEGVRIGGEGGGKRAAKVAVMLPSCACACSSDTPCSTHTRSSSLIAAAFALNMYICTRE